jgi:hypothetical protein
MLLTALGNSADLTLLKAGVLVEDIHISKLV